LPGRKGKIKNALGGGKSVLGVKGVSDGKNAAANRMSATRLLYYIVFLEFHDR
jgi:hypothetical protein